MSYSIPVPTGSRTLDASSDISLSLTTATTVWGINAAVNVEPTPTPTVVVAAESYDSELVAREGGGLQKRTPHVRRFLPVNVW